MYGGECALGVVAADDVIGTFFDTFFPVSTFYPFVVALSRAVFGARPRDHGDRRVGSTPGAGTVYPRPAWGHAEAHGATTPTTRRRLDGGLGGGTLLVI